jgi:hypothetical protein
MISDSIQGGKGECNAWPHGSWSPLTDSQSPSPPCVYFNLWTEPETFGLSYKKKYLKNFIFHYTNKKIFCFSVCQESIGASANIYLVFIFERSERHNKSITTRLHWSRQIKQRAGEMQSHREIFQRTKISELGPSLALPSFPLIV